MASIRKEKKYGITRERPRGLEKREELTRMGTAPNLKGAW